MATVVKFPTSNTVVTTGWTNPTYVYADDTSYATATPSGKNITVNSDFGTFGFDSDIPAGATINSVTVEVGWFVSTTSSVATLGSQVYVSGTAKGTEFTNATEPAGSPLVQTYTVSGLTLANLANSAFKVRVRATRGNSNTAFTGSLDYVSVTVDYTVAVTGVTVVPTSGNLNPGQTLQLTPTISPVTATDTAVTWSTDNSSVATVNSTGLVTAVGSGTAIITITTHDGSKTATSNITVTTPVTEVTLDITSKTLITNQTQQLTPTVSPSNADNKSVTWSSNNTSVATVNSSGFVTAVSPGNAIITVTTIDQGKTATCNITVNAPVAVTSVSINPSNAIIEKGSTTQLTAVVKPTDATNKSVSWQSLDTIIATVDSSGLVTSVSVGTATIIVTTNDGGYSSSANIEVRDTTPPQLTNHNSSVTDNSATILFTFNEPSYVTLYWGEDTNCGDSFILGDIINSGSHTINNLKTGTTYYYKIVARDAYNNISTYEYPDYSFNFTTTMNGYRIEKSTDNINFNFLDNVYYDQNSYDDTDIINDITYYYRIKRINNGDESNWSNVVSIAVSSGSGFSKKVISLDIKSIIGIMPTKIINIS